MLFPARTVERLTAAVRDSERVHDAELRIVIEGGLHPLAVWRGFTARHRALELFSRLHVWDTADNNGVLLYLQLVDRQIEIVADRGLNSHVSREAWDEVCRRIESAFREGRYEQGALDGVAAVTALLARHFPSSGARTNELPDAPVILSSGF